MSAINYYISFIKSTEHYTFHNETCMCTLYNALECEQCFNMKSLRKYIYYCEQTMQNISDNSSFFKLILTMNVFK
jgi:hypothetical protein